MISMKIQSVKAIPVKLPLPHVMEWATGRMTAQSHVLVRIMTDEGIEGIAEAIPRIRSTSTRCPSS